MRCAGVGIPCVLVMIIFSCCIVMRGVGAGGVGVGPRTVSSQGPGGSAVLLQGGPESKGPYGVPSKGLANLCPPGGTLRSPLAAL